MDEIQKNPFVNVYYQNEDHCRVVLERVLSGYSIIKSLRESQTFCLEAIQNMDEIKAQYDSENNMLRSQYDQLLSSFRHKNNEVKSKDDEIEVLRRELAEANQKAECYQRAFHQVSTAGSDPSRQSVEAAGAVDTLDHKSPINPGLHRFGLSNGFSQTPRESSNNVPDTSLDGRQFENGP